MLPRLSALFLAFASITVAQQPVAFSLAELIDQVPAAPRTAAEALKLSSPENPNVAGEVFADFGQRLEARAQEINTVPGMEDLQKKYSDPAFQAKMQAMSPAEQMAMAMKMQAEMQGKTGLRKGALQPPSPELQAALNAFQEENAAMPELAQTRPQAAEKADELKESEQTQHDAADREGADQLKKELAKFPPDQRSEGSPAFNAAVARINLALWKKHLAIVDERVAKTRAIWDQEKTRERAHLAAIDAKLKAAKYGEDSDRVFQIQLATYQSSALAGVQSLLDLAHRNLGEAASWQARYNEFVASDQGRLASGAAASKR